jgi:hypothetical protein
VNRAFRLELKGKGGREEIVEFAHLARPLNRYCRQADRLSKKLLASDRKRRAIDGEELAKNCARNAEGLTCSVSPCSTHFHACRAILRV